MKKIIFFIATVCISFFASAQIAPNFTSNDCNGTSYDLYSQLDAGKVIVVCWVMPCSTCVPATKTSYNVVQSFLTSNPNKVFLYLCDDYGDTPCASINSWANGISVPASASSLRFSNSAINMASYGAVGMPKIIIVGGSSHNILYSANVSVDGPAMQTVINNALNASSVEESISIASDLSIFPNPVNNTLNLTVSMAKQSNATIEIYDMLGNKVYTNTDKFSKGIHNIEINTGKFDNGIYFVKLNDSFKSKILKFNVSH
ncbi:MAG: T9SS type A sorting domain-containing protein [Bacteroidota bacterium]